MKPTPNSTPRHRKSLARGIVPSLALFATAASHAQPANLSRQAQPPNQAQIQQTLRAHDSRDGTNMLGAFDRLFELAARAWVRVSGRLLT